MWLISENCIEAVEAIPMAMRDEKNLEDVEKTDTVHDDVLDGLRYGLKSMLSPRQKPAEAGLEETLAHIPDMTQKHLAHLAFMHRQKKQATAFKLKRR